MSPDDDRPKLTYSERDRLRREGRSQGEARPKGRHAEAKARRASEQYVKEIDSLFTDAPGGQEGDALAEAMRAAHGSAELPQACRLYRAAVGFPEDAELATLFLDSSDEELVVGQLETLLAAVEAGRLSPTGSLRSQISILAEDFNDAVASVAEDILAAL